MIRAKKILSLHNIACIRNLTFAAVLPQNEATKAKFLAKFAACQMNGLNILIEMINFIRMYQCVYYEYGCDLCLFFSISLFNKINSSKMMHCISESDQPRAMVTFFVYMVAVLLHLCGFFTSNCGKILCIP